MLFSRKRLWERFITFASAVANVILGGHTCIAFKVDQIGPGGCSALQGRLQCTASEMGKSGTEIVSPILDKRKGRIDTPHMGHSCPPDFSTEPIYRLNLNTDNLVFHVKSNEVSSRDGTSLKLILVSKVKRLFVRITVANYVKIYNVAKYSAMFLNTF